MKKRSLALIPLFLLLPYGCKLMSPFGGDAQPSKKTSRSAPKPNESETYTAVHNLKTLYSDSGYNPNISYSPNSRTHSELGTIKYDMVINTVKYGKTEHRSREVWTGEYANHTRTYVDDRDKVRTETLLGKPIYRTENYTEFVVDSIGKIDTVYQKTCQCINDFESNDIHISDLYPDWSTMTDEEILNWLRQNCNQATVDRAYRKKMDELIQEKFR